MADNFIPKLRIDATISGIVCSDVFPSKTKKQVGGQWVDDQDAWVFNIEIPQENAPPVQLQLQTIDKPAKGDRIDFPIKLETALRTKYSIKGKCVISTPKQKAP